MRRLCVQFHLLLINKLAHQPLASEDQVCLVTGNIIILEEDDPFLQPLLDTGRVRIVGPVPYLSYLHDLHWVDMWLLLVTALSLGRPPGPIKPLASVTCSNWSRPFAGQQSGPGGSTVDQMATQLQALIVSRK